MCAGSGLTSRSLVIWIRVWALRTAGLEICCHLIVPFWEVGMGRILSGGTELKTVSDWTLYLGRETQAGPNANEVSRSVSQVIVHPNFNNTLLNNDIALMELRSVVLFTDFIRPICLAGSGSQFFNATSCWSTGWGKRLSNREDPDWNLVCKIGQ
ncbi:hypothetical protein GOODEAATRI_028629 [Goodea atripinnis]|uniref:Peptidase S1 domain-containing protein n=1 Tax=Goodea atripinnis TaxID=208336 RepID=A0ABV0N507_9TELE